MNKKLFAGGLPFSYSDEELRALFAAAGKVVSAVMVPDPAWGRTRGFGFVEMSTPEEAQAAIAQLNGMKIAEKNIYVTEAREKKTAPASAPLKHRPKEVPNRKAARLQRFPGVGQGGPPFPGGEPGGFRPRPGGSDRPYERPRREPGGFGAPRKGFSKPAKWEPRGDAKRSPGVWRPAAGPGGERSFPAPGRSRGDFGPPQGRGLQKSGDSPEGLASSRFGGPPQRGAGGAPSSGFGEPGRRPAKPFGKPAGKFGGRSRFDSPPSASGKPPKKEFWRKFEKKKPQPKYDR